MIVCPDELKLQAFYDGQLSEAEAIGVREHIVGCGSCSDKLAGLSSMSNIFAGADRPVFLPMSSARLHRAIDDAMDSALLRFAWSLSGIAACILVAGSVWMMRVNNQPVVAQDTNSVRAAPWTAVATTADADSLMNEQASPVAQWYLADAGRRNDELP